MKRDRRAALGIVLLLGAAAAIVAVGAWHGPVVLTLSAAHGVDTGDLLAFPLIALAVALTRLKAPQRPVSWAAPASAVALGALLMLAGVVAKEGGGPLVPTGGGTLDGTIHSVADTRPLPVGRWSNVALTYDGASLRLYVDGRQVSNRAGTGAIEAPGTPVWIGGNLPYGEHFDGLVDEVRIYDRALSPTAIRRDMSQPVAPAAGLVAGYAFDAGSGTTAKDSSGNRNTGEIEGASWAPGRFGDALRFDGGTAVVEVPASPSLNLRGSMTLSGWVRPSARQDGWRTIVQRQADAYILTASSDRLDRSGTIDDLRALLLVVAGGWFLIVVGTARSPWATSRRRSWWLPVLLFTIGSLADAALAPSGAFVGPALVALWLAATARGRAEQVAFLLGAVLLAGLTLDAGPARDEGSLARTVALGGLFVSAGLIQLAGFAATVRLARAR